MAQEANPAEGLDLATEAAEQITLLAAVRVDSRPALVNTCPDCETHYSEPLIALDQPPKYAGTLNPCFKCPICRCVWSPKTTETTVLRRVTRAEVSASDLEMVVEVRRVIVPYGQRDYICPKCERSIPTFKQVRLGKPARHAHELHDVLRCPFCMHFWSQRITEATVLSQ